MWGNLHRGFESLPLRQPQMAQCARSSADRALGCGPKGRGFESRRARQHPGTEPSSGPRARRTFPAVTARLDARRGRGGCVPAPSAEVYRAVSPSPTIRPARRGGRVGERRAGRPDPGHERLGHRLADLPGRGHADATGRRDRDDRRSDGRSRSRRRHRAAADRRPDRGPHRLLGPRTTTPPSTRPTPMRSSRRSSTGPAHGRTPSASRSSPADRPTASTSP